MSGLPWISLKKAFNAGIPPADAPIPTTYVNASIYLSSDEKYIFYRASQSRSQTRTHLSPAKNPLYDEIEPGLVGDTWCEIVRQSNFQL
jgi:hypothetical protein